MDCAFYFCDFDDWLSLSRLTCSVHGQFPPHHCVVLTFRVYRVLFSSGVLRYLKLRGGTNRLQLSRVIS